MSTDRASQRIVIAGASSLLGAEVKSLLEESRFAGWDLSLVDEETAAGTLTEAGGEASIIQAVEDGTFSRAQLVLFAGSPAFTEANLESARASGGFVIDMSGGALAAEDARVSLGRSAAQKDTKLHVVASAPGLVTGRLLANLTTLGATRFSIVFFRPVSEAGREGVEELEAQTSHLLSFQPIGQPVFDTQVAFSLLDRYGAASRESLQAVKERVRVELASVRAANFPYPAVQILHAPVFYGYTFVATAELNPTTTRESLVEVLGKQFSLDGDPAAPTGNLSASGDSAIHLAAPEPDPGQAGTWWFWGAADNIRLPAAIAVKLAEELLG